MVSWFVPLPETTAWASDTFGAAAVQLAVRPLRFLRTNGPDLSVFCKAIYPTVIIVLVSLNESVLDGPHSSKALSSDISEVGTHLTFAANPSVSVSAQSAMPKAALSPGSLDIRNSLLLSSDLRGGLTLDVSPRSELVAGDLEMQ